MIAVVSGTYEGAREAKQEMGKWPFIASITCLLMCVALGFAAVVGIGTIIRWL